jgi:hypothetical protein
MSATGRGIQRQERDFYGTPPEAVKAFLPVLEWYIRGNYDVEKFGFVEPCVGNYAIVKAIQAGVPEWSNIHWDTFDIAMPFDDVMGKAPPNTSFELRNMLDETNPFPLTKTWACCVTNPPYNLAEDFVRWSLKHCDLTCMLLRLNFLGSQKRDQLFKDIGMPDVFVLPKRPSFTGKGTDATEYAWMVWEDSRSYQEGTIMRL